MVRIAEVKKASPPKDPDDILAVLKLRELVTDYAAGTIDRVKLTDADIAKLAEMIAFTEPSGAGAAFVLMTSKRDNRHGVIAQSGQSIIDKIRQYQTLNVGTTETKVSDGPTFHMPAVESEFLRGQMARLAGDIVATVDTYVVQRRTEIEELQRKQDEADARLLEAYCASSMIAHALDLYMLGFRAGLAHPSWEITSTVTDGAERALLAAIHVAVAERRIPEGKFHYTDLVATIKRQQRAEVVASVASRQPTTPEAA